MPTRVETDGAFLTKHNALTEKFYQAKRAGQITPALQALFNKAHGYLSLVHTKALIANGIDQDYYVDEARTKLRSQEIDEALASGFKLTLSEVEKVSDQWGVGLV